VICDVEWVGKEREIEKVIQEANGRIDVQVGRIDRQRFTIICGDERRDEEEKTEETMSIMGRKLPTFDSSKPRHFLYIGSHETFLNTLSLNLGSNV
jgi:hypothetical protein